MADGKPYQPGYTIVVPAAPKGKTPGVSGATSTKAVSTALATAPPSQYQPLWHGTQTPTRIVIHDTEGNNPQSAIDYWLTQKKGLGAQIIIDADGTIIRVVPDDQVAYSTGGNNTGTLAIELVGHSSDTKQGWLAKSAQLKSLSEVLGYWSSKYNIPLVESTDHGVSTHAMNSAIYPQSDGHTDPGKGFPFQQVIQAAGGSVKAAPTGYDWEGLLADELGVPYSKNLKRFLDGWHTADNSDATNNPFNITVDYTGTATGDLSGNSAGVKNFPTPVSGIQATAQFIQNRVPQLIALLKSGDYKGAADVLQSSGWAGSNSSYGASVFSNFKQGAYTQGNNAPTALSPQGKSAASVVQSTDTTAAQAKSGAYIAAVEARAAALAQARATGHQSDPWVTVLKDKKGNVTGFGEAIGQHAPNNVLLIGGQPATKSMYQLQWSNTYASTYEAFTGKVATAAVQAKILESGVSGWVMQQQLAKQPSFTSSPIYKQQAAGIAEQAKQALGKQPPKSFVRDAIAQNWDANTITANIRHLPGYTHGPEYKANYATALGTYQGIYGDVPPAAPPVKGEKPKSGPPEVTGPEAFLKQAAVNGWTQDQVAATLRADPAYKYSPEYQTKAVNFLDAMGLFTGTRAIAGIQPQSVIQQNVKGTKVGPTSNLQIGVGPQ